MTEATEDKPKTAARAKAEPKLNIFQRIAAISKEAGALAPESKGGVPFAFRGVDGTVAHLTPFLHKYEVIVYPHEINHIVTEREVIDKAGNSTGRIVKTSQVETTFRAVGPDGEWIQIQTAGLADDFADRSTAQAQSVAYRVALLQLFHLPTHSKEPEESGEEVLKGRDAAAASTSAPRGPKAVEAAKAAAAGDGPGDLKKLQADAKVLGRKLGKSPADLNALGSELSGGKEQTEWFNDVSVMEKIIGTLKAEAEAGA